MQITTSSLSVNQLFGSANEQYVIPTYQRRYSWQDRQIWELIEDIQLIEDGETHLLGSIVCLTGPYKAGLNKLELVDGQQRLTTITIILICIAEKLREAKETGAAGDLEKLIFSKPLGGEQERKVRLDSIDSDDFDKLTRNDGGLEFSNGRLHAAFTTVRQWLQEKSIQEVGDFLYRMTNQSRIVRLDIADAKDAFKLFETINNRGLKLSLTDIIKNFILGNAARFGPQELSSARNSWASLIRYLDGVNSDSFFRYYLMAHYQTRFTASKVIYNFKWMFMNEVAEAAALPDRHLYSDEVETEELDYEEEEVESQVSAPEIVEPGVVQISFQEFLNRLTQSAKAYGELVLAKTGDASIDRHLRNLRMIKAAQTYGFLMHLRTGGCSRKSFLEVLKLTESFVLRRHVCRERSNDTETLFARMCSISPNRPVKETREAYVELCPSDEKFREEFSTAAFTANLIDRARYCLEQIELAKHGEHAELQVLGSEDVHVEHIIPQKIKTKKAKQEYGDWENYLGTKAEIHHQKYVSRIGNLTLFAGELNISASNNPFEMKKEAYGQSSILMTQELLEYANFKFKEVEQRSKELADAALEIWPLP